MTEPNKELLKALDNIEKIPVEGRARQEMPKQGLREEIAQLLAGRHHLGIESATADAEDIVALIKQAGYKSPEEVVDILAKYLVALKEAGWFQEEAELVGRLLDKGWIPPEEVKGYVKLADDRSLPEFSTDKVDAIKKILLKLTASRFWSDREAWAEITTREILKLFPEPVLTLSEARLPRHYWGGDTEVSMREECPFEDGKQAQLAHDQKTLRGNDEHKKV